MQIDNVYPGWDIVKQIGAGSFGKVYEIERTENDTIEKAALKVMSVPVSRDDIDAIYDSGFARTYEDAENYINNQIQTLSQECKVMSELQGNSNIVHYIDHSIIPHDGWMGADIFIRMELLTPLSKYIKSNPLTEHSIIQLGIDICRALEVCHSRKPAILHRDIKQSNIMVDANGTFKLGDFGVARIMEGTHSAHTKAGTEDYMAPEVLRRQSYRAPADIYSLGIVLYKLLNNGLNPFLPTDGSLITESIRIEAQNHRLDGKPIPEPVNGSKLLKATVQKALKNDPNARFQTAEEFRLALEQCVNAVGHDELDNEAEKTFYQKNLVDPIDDINPTSQNMPPQEVPPDDAYNRPSLPVGPPTPYYPPEGKSPTPIIIIALTVTVILVALAALLYFGKDNISAMISQFASGRTVSTLEIQSASDTILQGDSVNVWVNIDGEYANINSKKIDWTTDKDFIADVNSGVLTAHEPGEATITATYAGKNDQFKVTVVEVEKGSNAEIYAERNTVNISSGGSYTMDFTFGGDLPSNYSGTFYCSPGLGIEMTLGETENNTVPVTMRENASSVDKGYIRVLLYDTDNPLHVVAARKIEVNINPAS